MGGIAGLMTRDGAPPAATPLLQMADALRHRGPDGDGHYRLGDVGMVLVRLAIVDLATGDQPLYEPGGAALVADAEIFNHLELRRDLPGIAFSTGSDCEPPLHLYRRQGLDFTGGLRGMYAIALHDPASGALVLARDPFGIKPLYYAETPSGFAFASQPRALLAAGLLSPALVRAARNELVQMQFTTGRATIFAGIDRLLPGEMVVVRPGRIVERRRCKPLGQGGPEPLGEEEALARLDAVLADSVRLHRRADVPCGLLLSGGIDSTALLAMMARLDERPVAALTLGFVRPPARRRGASLSSVSRSSSQSAISGGGSAKSPASSTIPPPTTRHCRSGGSPPPRARPGSRSSSPARAATNCSPATAATAASCGHGGWAVACLARAGCSTGSACCGARSPAGATASPPPRRAMLAPGALHCRRRRPSIAPTSCRTTCC
jgi:asparagine synthase (glutamine-hydrolysing)